MDDSKRLSAKEINRLKVATAKDLEKLKLLGKEDKIIWVTYRQGRNGGISKPADREVFDNEESAIARAKEKEDWSLTNDEKPFKYGVECKLTDARLLNGGAGRGQGAPRRDPDTVNFSKWSLWVNRLLEECYLDKVRSQLAEDWQCEPEEIEGSELINYLVEIGLETDKVVKIPDGTEYAASKLPTGGEKPRSVNQFKNYAPRFTKPVHESLEALMDKYGSKQQVLLHLVWNALGELGYL
jgi:hypothetical protein